ncbi:MAG TPA: DUF1549 domain-containing protein, partial [Armatimonadota bacterium]|nr:DUF1549 domain-containing protein [Armatimonadota bacterium]
MRLSVFAAGGMVAAWCGVAALAAAPAKPARPASRPQSPKVAAPQPKTAAAPKAPALAPEAMEFFEKEVRPVLAEQCYSCHGPKVRQASLRVDSRAALLKGGDKGPALVPGTPEKSLLIQAIHHKGLQMPPGRKLPEKQVAALEKWVAMGAPWPGDTGKTAAGPQSWTDILQSRRGWWSLQPVRKPAVPAVRNVAWSAQPVDRFILRALEGRGLKPAPPADRATLVRRVYLTLTGLPPTPAEIEQFLSDPSPNAYERLVDRVLASPHYGERWARHWMDVVRFGETHGYEWNYEVKDAWRYRDYLIRAFNMDVPYDQFVREHIAGDLMQQPRWNRAEGTNESRLATAFYRFGEAGHDVFKEIGLDVLDNQIDTLSKAFQATTISCARCHDHKLDAVSTKDYYALLGILVSSRQVVQTLDADDANAQRTARLAELKNLIRREAAAAWTGEAGDSARYLRAAQAVREKKPEAEALKQGLDAGRLAAWVAAIEKRQPGMEDPLHAWGAAVEGAAQPMADLPALWRGLKDRYVAERTARSAANAKEFVPFGDFRPSASAGSGWRLDGLGVRGGPSPSGDFTVATEGDKAISTVFPAGLFTHSLSERLN